jgi:transposase-like protein
MFTKRPSSPFSRLRWTEEDPRAALAALERSGRPVSVFAAEHGLDPQRLYVWRRRLAGGEPSRPLPAGTMLSLGAQRDHEQTPSQPGSRRHSLTELAADPMQILVVRDTPLTTSQVSAASHRASLVEGIPLKCSRASRRLGSFLAPRARREEARGFRECAHESPECTTGSGEGQVRTRGCGDPFRECVGELLGRERDCGERVHESCE